MDTEVCHFSKAQYRTGEEICIYIPPQILHPQLSLFRLAEEIPVTVESRPGQVVLHDVPEGNYGVCIGEGDFWWEGAFDVVNTARHITRYGFLSDFSTCDGDAGDVEWMRDLHLNTVQFYDWMFRHDLLISPEEEYADPMGRPTSLNTIRKKIAVCRDFGIRPFAYGAVYAAGEETFQSHPEWAMYTMDHQPMKFADWLYFMNVSEGCGWTDHLLEQYRNALRFGFEGIHMDTYGFPKAVWNSEGKAVDLSNEFPKLIDRMAQMAQKENERNGVIFNAVNNWPTETVATSEQDSVYIEVWPPHNTYFDLYTLIREVKLKSNHPVTLAAYMKPFQEADQQAAMAALRLCWAAICASGGTQLVFGEGQAVLQDSYYANYGKLQPDMLPIAQKYCDFLVRYADLLYDNVGMDVSKTAAGGINEDICFFGHDCEFSVDGKPNTVWTIIKESSSRLSMQFINLRGNDDLWNAPKNPPKQAECIKVRMRFDRPLRGIYCASPDKKSLAAIKLSYTCEDTPTGRYYDVDLPVLKYWCAVWAEVEDEQCADRIQCRLASKSENDRPHTVQ